MWYCIKKTVTKLTEQRYEQKDLQNISAQWAEELKKALEDISDDWMEAAFAKLPHNEKV